jgi:hypothetical protein
MAFLDTLREERGFSLASFIDGLRHRVSFTVFIDGLRHR